MGAQCCKKSTNHQIDTESLEISIQKLERQIGLLEKQNHKLTVKLSQKKDIIDGLYAHIRGDRRISDTKTI